MVFSQNNNQRCGQHRAVKTKSNSTATRRHKVSQVASQPLPAPSQGESKLCSRGTKFMQARPSCHCKTIVSVSLQRLHASLAVRICVFLHREHYDKCFGDNLLGIVKGFSLFVSIYWWWYFTQTCKYCHLVIEYLTVISLLFPRHLHIP